MVAAPFRYLGRIHSDYKGNHLLSTNLSLPQCPTLGPLLALTCPCRSLQTPGSCTLGLARCCLQWTCCWRGGHPQCARYAWRSRASSPSSIADHHASRLETGPRRGSPCLGRSAPVPRGPEAWGHLKHTAWREWKNLWRKHLIDRKIVYKVK